MVLLVLSESMKTFIKMVKASVSIGDSSINLMIDMMIDTINYSSTSMSDCSFTSMKTF